MYFTNPRSINRNSAAMYNQANNNKRPAMMMNININTNVKNNLNQTNGQMVQKVAPENNIPNDRKVTWGPPFWFFFHTIAEKVKEEKYTSISKELFNMIKQICANLPCPNCIAHATDYLSKINMNSINTKEKLKIMLLNFHNDVNLRKGYPHFTYEQLNEKYSKAIFRNIFNHFIHHFRLEHRNVRMLSEDMFRKRYAQEIINWFHAHLEDFN